MHWSERYWMSCNNDIRGRLTLSISCAHSRWRVECRRIYYVRSNMNNEHATWVICRWWWLMFDLFGCRAITIYKICIRQPPINSNMPKVIFPKRKARFREKKYESNLSGPFSFLLSFYQKLLKTIKKEVSEIRFIVLYCIFCVLAICNIENMGVHFLLSITSTLITSRVNFLCGQWRTLDLITTNLWIFSSQSVFCLDNLPDKKSLTTHIPNQIS